jgi:beta-phosphoglucomutase-like phosphatase (HAD superfamily)
MPNQIGDYDNILARHSALLMQDKALHDLFPRRSASKNPAQQAKSPEETYGFIFDFEGAVVDHLPYRAAAWRRVLEQAGIRYSPGTLDRYCHGTNREFLQRIVPARKLSSAKIDLWGQQVESIFLELYQAEVRLIDGLERFFNEAATKRIPMALISDLPRPTVNALCHQLQLQTIFKATITAEDVERGKSNPDSLLKACMQLELLPEECIAFVTLDAAIEASYRAKMKSFIVRPREIGIAPGLPNIVQVIIDYQMLDPHLAYTYSKLADIVGG